MLLKVSPRFKNALTRSWLVTCSFQLPVLNLLIVSEIEIKNLVKNCPDTVVVLVFFFAKTHMNNTQLLHMYIIINILYLLYITVCTCTSIDRITSIISGQCNCMVQSKL